MSGFTPDQAFFLAFAQAWCEVQRPERARLLAATDPHSPSQWRVNGPLSNLDAFPKAFSCPEGSPMVRSGAKQCVLW